jgi:sugar lactone lactonase YvrE
MRQLIVILGIIVIVFGQNPAGISAYAETFPDIVPLPDGFRPEGVVVGGGHQIYAGSLANGAIYRSDLRTGQGEIIVPGQEGRIAVGLSFDKRSNFLFVAGGPTGAGYVYDAQTGVTVEVYQLTTALGNFINDVVVTRSAAYFTDSFRPFLYRIALGPQGQLPEPGTVEEIPLSGDFDFIPIPGTFNTNGIDATANGKSLLIVNSATGELYNVDPQSGNALLIDLRGESVPAGDGILLDGKTLYVVQNRLNRIAVVQLNAELTAGEIITHITDPTFDVPTTIAEFGNSLYAVNARFGTPPTPETEYEIVQVTKEK